MELKVHQTLYSKRILQNSTIPVRDKFLFLVWPMGALVSAFRNYKHLWAKNLFWLFCIFYGFTFVIGDKNSRSNDAVRYTEQLEYFHTGSVSFSKLTNILYSSEGGFVDVYQPVLTWFLGIFTDSPKWLFATYALVFGYFYSRNIWILIERSGVRLSGLLLLLLIVFALMNPIWNINGVRMWTAAQIFIYGIFNYYILSNKKSGLWWILSSIFVHFSFVFPVLLFLLFIFLPHMPIPLLLFYVISSTINDLNLSAVGDFLSSVVPEFLIPRVKGYTNVDYAELIGDQALQLSWHVRLVPISVKVIIYIFIFYMMYYGFKKKNDYHQIRNLLSLALFLGGWANIAALVPSGGRFLVLSNVLFMATFFLYFSRPPHVKISLIRLPVYFLLAFIIIFNIRVGLDYTGFLTLFGNPLLSFFLTENLPLIEYIKGLF